MERFCGICLPFIKSKRNPYSNLVKNIFRKQQLTLIQHLPHISLFSESFEKDDKSLNDSFNFKVGSKTIQLKSPKSKTQQDITIANQKLIIQYYIFLGIVERNAIVLQNEVKNFQKELAEVMHW
jgi:hypothetical protein